MIGKNSMQRFAEEICKTIAGRVERLLRANTKDMQTDGATLTSFWDELCVQVQGCPFFFWESYVDMGRRCIADEFSKLGERERQAVKRMVGERTDVLDGTGSFAAEGIIVEYILDEHLLVSALRCSTPSIEMFKAKDRAL